MARYESDRRQFLKSVSASSGSMFAIGGLGLNSSFGDASMLGIRQDDLVKLQPDHEPLVRLIESTPARQVFRHCGNRDAKRDIL